jgi:uncharacterized repeat protein (TIGR01451 family)
MRKLSFLAVAFTLLGVGVGTARSWAEGPVLPAELQIQKAVNATVASPGDVLTYSITVVNVGAGPSLNTIVTDFVPANTTYVPGSTTLSVGGAPATPVADRPGGISPLSQGLNIDGLAIFPQPGYFKIITFQVRINLGTPAGTIIRDSATASSDSAGTVTSNEVQTTVRILVTFTITKTADRASIQQGQVVTFTIVATNTGNGTATNVIIRDVPPTTSIVSYVLGSTTLNGAAVADVGGTSPVLSAAGFNVGSLAAGASARVTLQFQLTGCPPPGGLTFADSASVASDQTTALLSAPVIVLAAPDTTPPVITIEAPTATQVITRCDSLLIRALIVDICPGVAPGSVSILIDGVVVASGLSVGADGRVSFTVPDLSGFALGPHVITVTAADLAGNVGTSAPLTINITCSLDCALELLRRAEAAGTIGHEAAGRIRQELILAGATTGTARCAHLRCAFLLVRCAEDTKRPGVAGLRQGLEAELDCLRILFGCPPFTLGPRDS